MFKISIVLSIVLTTALSGFYWYYTDSQSRLATLKENTVKLETQVLINQETMKTLKADYLAATQEVVLVNQVFAELRRQNAALAEKLEKNDIGALAVKKPGLIETLVNRGTKNAGRCFEILSGAPLTTQEKEATNGMDFNNECPQNWPGYSSD